MEAGKFGPDYMNPADMSTQMLFQQVARMHVNYAMQLMEPMGMNFGRAGILLAVENCGPLSQREIADKIGVKPPSATVAIQKLEKMGYVEKRPDPSDQRIARVQITESGRKCLEGMEGIVDKVGENLFVNMTTEEKILLRRLLLQMQDNLIKNRDFKMKRLDPCPKM